MLALFLSPGTILRMTNHCGDSLLFSCLEGEKQDTVFTLKEEKWKEEVCEMARGNTHDGYSALTDRPTATATRGYFCRS